MNTKESITILLLSAPIGSGHKLAAEALAQVFRQYKNVNVLHGNVFDFFPMILGNSFLRTYLWILDKCPWLYALAYKWGNHESSSLWMRSLINGTLAYLGRGYLNRVQPDVVIATHATPAGIVSIYKQRQRAAFPLAAVVTDYTVHRWWLCEGVAPYFIADEQLRENFSDGYQTVAFGIPIRQEFAYQDRNANRKAFNWNYDKNVCLLMGGGEGLLPMKEIIDALLQGQQKNLHIVAVTGHNEKLAADLRTYFGDQVEIYGFVDNIPVLMSAADMIITKAGGLTSAEVLASNLDLIIYRPLPGQETNNAKFLQTNYGACIAETIADVRTQVQELCQKADVSVTSERKNFGKPLAAQNICKYILEVVLKN